MMPHPHSIRPRLYLSPPHMGAQERALVDDAFRTNWIAPVGPHVDAFEQEFCREIGIPAAAALSSGTAALHLALKLVGVRPGDEVFCSSLTFVGTANPIMYLGARPVFFDSSLADWNLDPALLCSELDACARHKHLPKAVVVVDLYGQCANYDLIAEACARYEIPLIEDAAEALGATYRGKNAGTFGRFGIFSFNGNKVITTSTGGMLVSGNAALIEKARFLATQARDPAPHYQHSEIGYNYRLSNVLAAIGRGQLAVLRDRVESRRKNFEFYMNALESIPGISFMPEAENGRSTRWLTVILVNPDLFGATREDIRLNLESMNIEARPSWKPLHLQPVFSTYRMVGGAVSEALFEQGLCLPSGSQMGKEDLNRVVQGILNTPKKRY